MIQKTPFAKINLGLVIHEKLPNGYHNLETLLYPYPELKDFLEIEESSELSLEIEGIPLEGDWEENLCIKAWKLLKSELSDLPPVRIYLEKKIPAGAGLGGGSSDAAHTLFALNELFRLAIPFSTLIEIAAKLGADVPFFLWNMPMLATGIGTTLYTFPMKLPYKIRLITPPIHSSTVVAYKQLRPEMYSGKIDLRGILQKPIETWREHLPNDLEKAVFPLYPELAKIKAELYEQGAIYAAMSGSGSAMFGLFA